LLEIVRKIENTKQI